MPIQIIWSGLMIGSPAAADVSGAAGDPEETGSSKSRDEDELRGACACTCAHVCVM